MTRLSSAETPNITAREAEVLDLVARYLTNAQIAESLVISERTVETHVSSLLRKLGFADRRGLARHAATASAVRPGAPGRGLPVPATPFVGRVAERAALTEALTEHRLVTATGPGGIGKTRLAIAVAGDLAPERRGGVWFVDLVRVSDPGMVAATVAAAVGVPEQQTASIEAGLVSALTDRDALLVLDNCEHLLDAVRACVDRIIAGCPAVTVLATSRIRLLLPYERVYVVPGLSVDAAGGDAVELFDARVAGVTGDEGPPETARVAALCRALDGMALSIELAAARFPALGLDGLETGLDQRMRFLTGGTRGEDRHRSLRAAIGWSYDLLTPEDRTLLNRAAVFSSWFDVEAARSVAGVGQGPEAIADGLARLAEQSLLDVRRGDPTSYRALETIRQFGLEQLEAGGELEQVRAGHEQYCRRALAALSQIRPADIDESWCARFDRLADEVGASVTWCASDERNLSAGAELAADLAKLLFLRGRPARAQRSYEQSAAFTGTFAERAELLRLAAGAAASRYAGEEALRLHRRAADAALMAGDQVGAARDLAMMAMYLNRAGGIMSTRHSPEEAAALIEEAVALSGSSPGTQAALAVAKWGPRPDRAVAARTVALAERAGDGVQHSIALDMLIAADLFDNEIADAMRAVQKRLAVLEELPVGPLVGFELSDGYLMGAEVGLASGDLVGAAAHADALAALPFYRDEDHLGISRRLLVDALAGRHDDVLRTAARFRAGWERAGRPVAPNLARAPYAVAMVHGMRGEDDLRATWVQMTIDLGSDPEVLSGCSLGWAPVFDGLLALHRGEPAAAMRRLAVDIADASRGHPWVFGTWLPWYAALWAEAAALDNHPDAPTRVARSSHVVRNNPIAEAIVERARAVITGDHQSFPLLADTFGRLGCPYQQERTLRLGA